jgi:pre-rRNA-processing protein TSR2
MQMSPEAKAGFEEGVGLVFSQWTALCLAVEQEWGGPDSEDKANHMIDDVIQWFYKKRGACSGCQTPAALAVPWP